MRYLACFKPLGAGADAIGPLHRKHFDVTACLPPDLLDHQVQTRYQDDPCGLRSARATPPWIRWWSGAFEIEIERLDDRRFGRALAALHASEGEGDWHWVRYTRYAAGDELRFMRGDGLVRHVQFINDEPRVSVAGLDDIDPLP